MARLAGKIALITGATGGIGTATAQAYLREGAKVMLVGRSEEKLTELRERLGHAESLATFATDAADEAGVRDSIDATVKAFGGLDIVFAGAIGFPGLAPYIASKHAVNGLTKTMARELAPAGIRVNAIAPGMIDNRMLHSIADQIDSGNGAGVLEQFMPLIPMERLGRSEEIAAFAVFLGSDESSYCTGSIHLADGGYVAA